MGDTQEQRGDLQRGKVVVVPGGCLSCFVARAGVRVNRLMNVCPGTEQEE